MQYVSTRNKNQKCSAAQAIAQGLASDGGLLTPEVLPKLSPNGLTTMTDMSYQQRAVFVMNSFLEDFTASELSSYANHAYGPDKFDTKEVAPVRAVDDSTYCLELWHGPTCAFKDMALQMLPHLLSASLVKNEEKKTVCILVATSGDTGKAALEGFRDVDKTRILVFYPKDGVSDIQQLQMRTQEGGNDGACAVVGNFDDAQTGVKRLFSDESLRETLAERGYFFSSANSINWGRILPQVVYYISAYCDLLREGKVQKGEAVNICVPTGNFGNILSAYYAGQMGVPIHKLICASNRNNVLTDFIETGVYDRRRPFHVTTSPSMDILVSSNLERLLYFLSKDAERVAGWMKQLGAEGRYDVGAELREAIERDFEAGYCDDEGTAAEIARVWRECGYLIDTHTAVGLHSAKKYMEKNRDGMKMLVASTASPYKFASDVYESITGKKPSDELSALTELSELTKTEIPYPLRDIDKRKIRFDKVIDKTAMPEEVLGTLGIKA